MLVTFHAIWYVITELSTPAWQKDVRDITFDVIQAMKEAKKESKQPEREDEIFFMPVKHCLNLHTVMSFLKTEFL